MPPASTASPLRRWVRGLLARRPDDSDAQILAGEQAPFAENPVRVLSWNIHFGAGSTLNDARRFSRDDVLKNLESIAAFVLAQGAHVVALQEVDRDAMRSARLDQLELLRELTGLQHAAFATTWDAAWVPYPLDARPHRQYGRVWSGQAVLSRYPIVRHARFALPQPRRYSRVHNFFYLHRCLQEVELDLGRQRLTLLNAHLEAFDVPNRRLHARLLAQRMASLRGPALALGDFNAVPPEASQRHAFHDEPHADNRGDDSLSTLRGVGWRELGAGEPTFPAGATNRRLDYIFASPGLSAEGGGPVDPVEPLSDHLPLRADLTLGA